MPRHDKTTEQIEAETDQLLLEQAKAFIRDLRTTTRNAPYGKIIDRDWPRGSRSAVGRLRGRARIELGRG